jgi:thiol-disulfide isomerase/thioredoxin
MKNRIQTQSACHPKGQTLFFFFTFASLWLAIFSCSDSTTVKRDAPIVIITKEAPESQDYSFSFTRMRAMNFGNIQYVDTALVLTYYKLRPLPYDTIILYSNHNNFELSHNYTAFDKIHYLLNQGDTLFLTYTDKNIPYAKILNRSYNENELNYDYLFVKHIPQPDTLSIREAYYYYSFINESNTKYSSLKNEAGKRLKQYLTDQMIYLDSLQKNLLISGEYYDYRKNNILSTIFIEELDSVPHNSIFLSDSLYLKYDSLIYQAFYRDLLNKQIKNFVRPPFNPYNPPPYEQITFKNIIYSPDYSNTIKKYVFKSIAKDLRIETLNDELTKMLTDYRSITGDSLSYFSLKEKFGLSEIDSIIAGATKINTTPLVSKEKLMDEIIAKYRGKVVVVDFWATWCQPCIRMMQDTKPLKREMQDKDVVFLYITDKSSPEETWRKRIQDIGGEHYYVSKAEWAYLLPSFDFKAIPAYLLYDANGVLNSKIAYPDPEELSAKVKGMLSK